MEGTNTTSNMNVNINVQGQAALEAAIKRAEYLENTVLPKVAASANAAGRAINAMGSSAKALDPIITRASFLGHTTLPKMISSAKIAAQNINALGGAAASLDPMLTKTSSLGQTALPKVAASAKEAIQSVNDLGGAANALDPLAERASYLSKTVMPKLTAAAKQVESGFEKIGGQLPGNDVNEPPNLSKAEELPSKEAAAPSKAGLLSMDIGANTEKGLDKIEKKAAKSQGLFHQLGSAIKKALFVDPILNALQQGIQQLGNMMQTGISNMASAWPALGQSLGSVKDSLAGLSNSFGAMMSPILMTVLPIFNQIINAAITAANAIGMFFARLFGGRGTYVKIGKAAGGAAKSTSGVGSAAKNAAEDMKELDKATNTLGIDELNVLQQPEANKSSSSGSGGGGGEGGGLTYEEVAIDSSIAAFADTLLQKLEPAREALGKLQVELDRLGQFAWQGLVDFYNTFLMPVGDWVLGEGLPRFIDAITNGLAIIDWGNINASLHGLWEALAPFAIHVGEGLLWFWESVLVPLGTWTVNAILPVFLDALAAVLSILNGVAEALTPAWQILWDVFFVPLGQWTADLAVAALEGLATALEHISDWVSENSELVAGIVTVFAAFAAGFAIVSIATHIINAIQTISTAIGGFVTFLTEGFGMAPLIIGAIIAALILLITHWDEVQAAFAAAAEWFSAVWQGFCDSFSLLWQTLCETFGIFYETMLKPIFDGLLQTLLWLWTEYLKPLWDNLLLLFQSVGELLTALWQNILLPAITAIGQSLMMLWTNTLLPLVQFFMNLFGPAISAVVNAVGTVFGSFFAIISTIVSSVIQLFTGVINFFKNVFAGNWSAAWQSIATAFSGIWNTISNGLKGILNKIIGALNGLIRGVESGINYILSGVRAAFSFIQGIIDGASNLLSKVGIDVHFEMPEIGDVHFGQIPTLASGAVLTQRTLFEGGEYPGAQTNPEIVSPLSMMKGAFRQALAEQGGMGGSFTAEQPIELSLDGDVFYRAMVKIKQNRGVTIGSAFAEAY